MSQLLFSTLVLLHALNAQHNILMIVKLILVLQLSVPQNKYSMLKMVLVLVHPISHSLTIKSVFFVIFPTTGIIPRWHVKNVEKVRFSVHNLRAV